jgi:hypothetical protein
MRIVRRKLRPCQVNPVQEYRSIRTVRISLHLALISQCHLWLKVTEVQMLDTFSPPLDKPSAIDLMRCDTDPFVAFDSRIRPELADPFRPRWRLRVIPAGVAVSLFVLGHGHQPDRLRYAPGRSARLGSAEHRIREATKTFLT